MQKNVYCNNKVNDLIVMIMINEWLYIITSDEEEKRKLLY